MKKLWSYIALFFVGLSAGIVIAVKWLNEAGTEITIKKIKSKRNKGQSDINIPLNVKSAKKPAKTKRERKIDRLAEKIENKRQRSLRRLEKNS